MTEDLLELFGVLIEVSSQFATTFKKNADTHYLRNMKLVVGNTSGEVSGTLDPRGDLSEVLLDLDLMEDLLEFLGVLVEASLDAT